MSLVIDSKTPAQAEAPTASAAIFVLACLSLMIAALLLAGWLPIGFSIVTVFLFAGPHNWLEARYMLSRMPAKWGPLAGYFALGLGGVLLLCGTIWAMPFVAAAWHWSDETWLTALAGWYAAICLWIIALTIVRSRQHPKRDWSWVLPLGLLICAVICLYPLQAGVLLVYLHPCLALWFLDRELRRLHSPWRKAYRYCLCLVPICLGILSFQLTAAPDLPGDDVLREAISVHAGGGVLAGVSTHCLVACHTFLEMLHYSVWIIAIPLLSVKQFPWQTTGIPLARRSPLWRSSLQVLLACGFVVCLILWGAFWVDYPTTRTIYFTLAITHVLAEVPFLLRLL